MTIPTVAVISKVVLSSGAINVTLRANDDPASDSVATFYVTPVTASADIDSWLVAQKQRVSDRYAAVQAAQSALGSIS
jgi:hypothetical protein